MIYIIERESTKYVDIPCEEAVKRDFTNDIGEVVSKWSIEINTLEELHEFIYKYGSIVIYDDPTPNILIYDDYIE